MLYDANFRLTVVLRSDRLSEKTELIRNIWCVGKSGDVDVGVVTKNVHGSVSFSEEKKFLHPSFSLETHLQLIQHDIEKDTEKLSF